MSVRCLYIILRSHPRIDGEEIVDEQDGYDIVRKRLRKPRSGTERGSLVYVRVKRATTMRGLRLPVATPGMVFACFPRWPRHPICDRLPTGCNHGAP